ncbi:T9SS type A sorting domain-containing protein [Patiriisocius marinus]|uniref:Secretion system C-terminal sorting domain-containing protein n=1 Tax=Patiriisocius marinus TaxID=1397112 RepID=A0A5J4IRW8_9FLAO|nr:T9SS type A sorting domain-containing protein [Patiriisocius marinus]GER60665.1 hypothetical protein ULMA_27730 [Patiriisocius marinus]
MAQEPASWTYATEAVSTIIELPALDHAAIAQEDAINDLDKSLPWRYGISRPIDIDITIDGEWTDIPDLNGRIWRAGIQSKNAVNLSVNFNEFYIPLGASLYLYNEDKTDVTRAYGHNENNDSGAIGSWFVEGDLIWIEYFEPYGINEDATLAIENIIHGYRMGKVVTFLDGQRGLNDSGACNYDVNCDTGEDFNDHKNIVKKAVALLNLGNGYLCSASLMNNTGDDKRPFLLTANHCLQNSNPAMWSVRFNWMSPSPICGEEDETLDIQTNFTMSGAVLKASSALSDFALVELNTTIPLSWDVTFAGWDMSDDNPEFEVGIHHPNGDIMKVCRDNDGAVKENANGTEVWLIGGGAVGEGDGWEIGTTESGSSGSPLFNEDGRVIGQLYAGQSSCNGNETNNDYDIYGRLGVSWNSGVDEQTRLKDWLDPLNTGQTTINSKQNVLSIPDNELTGKLEIYPNPASTYITITNSRFPNLTYNFYNAFGQRLMGGSLSNTDNLLDINSCADGIYFLHLVDEDSNQEITKKILISK